MPDFFKTGRTTSNKAAKQGADRAKTAQREEQQYRTILQAAMDGFLLTDTHGNLLDINPAYCRMSGYSAPELLAMNIADLDTDEMIGRRMQQIVGQREMRFKTRHRSKDGRLIEVEVSAQYLPLEEGRVVSFFLRDITARKQAMVALRKNEERFRTIFEQAHQGIVINSPSFAFEEVNPAFCRMIGYTADEFLSLTFADITHPDHIQQDIESVKQLGQGKIPFYHTQKRYICKNGQIIWADVIVSTIRDEHSDALQYYLTIINDISERMQAEQEKADLQAQLQQAQKLESVGRLAGGVAHDFNNMLNIIMGYAELAMTKVNSDESLHQDLEEIITAAERSAKVTRQLLAFARKQTVTPEVLDLNRVVARIHNMLERIISEQIQLEWLPGKELWPVKMDPDQIDQILANLCVNARDAIHGEGKISITTGNRILDAQACESYPGSVPGEYVWLAVSDDGSGMDSYTQAHIFEPFFTTKNVGEGTGLGMAMVYGAVRQNHGFITVDSALDQGTTFTLYFPRHVDRRSRPSQAQDAVDMPTKRRETILLVEDESAVLNLTRKILENLGYTVLAANSPQQAIELSRDHNTEIHLLVTDVIMPGMSGRDLWQKLCMLQPEIKCVFMSGYPDNVIAEHGVLDTDAHFIHKPFSMKTLSTKVQAALNGK